MEVRAAAAKISRQDVRGSYSESDANDGFWSTARKWLAGRPLVCSTRTGTGPGLKFVRDRIAWNNRTNTYTLWKISPTNVTLLMADDGQLIRICARDHKPFPNHFSRFRVASLVIHVRCLFTTLKFSALNINYEINVMSIHYFWGRVLTPMTHPSEYVPDRRRTDRRNGKIELTRVYDATRY